MPKHKKTREQKIKADVRNQTTLASQQIHTSPQYVFSAKNIPSRVVEKVQQQALSTTALIKKDLQKTAIISLAIVVLQILFYFLLHNHMLAISFVRY